uniref:Ribokinase n=1 Tax=Setaria digitata TaxID=48799 RepID=A0A915PZV6_9BILA
MIDIIVHGSIIQDLVSYTDQFPRPGETVRGTFATSSGGKGANQAAQAAMLGAKVYMIGTVGKDAFGKSNVDNLKAFGVKTEYIENSASGKTGCATIIVTKEGENSIVISPGANLECSASRINELEKVVSSAKLAEYLAGQIVRTIEDAQQITRRLLDTGPSIVILTLGAKGVVYGTKYGDSGHIMVPSVKVVETTGAGDSFCGALVYFLVKRPELELKEQIRRAAHISTYSVQRKGTRDSYPWPKDLPSDILM